MSFGFSISDFAFCAQVCYDLYHALKEASRECEAFAQEILHLQSLLQALSNDMKHVSEQPDGLAALASRRSMLSEHGSRCIELLVADIAGQKDFLKASDQIDSYKYLSGTDATAMEYFIYRSERFALRQRFSQAKFARKIPRLREAVASIVSKLTLEIVILNRYGYMSKTSYDVKKHVTS